MKDRREKDGVAVVTGRGKYIKPLFHAAGIPARMVVVQDGPAWPDLRPPAIVDTVGMPVEQLVVLLANPPKLKTQGKAAHPTLRASSPSATPMLMTLAALVDPDDYRALRLCALCPAVRVICSDDLPVLRLLMRHLSGAVAPRSSATGPACLVSAPPYIPLEPLLVPALAALLASPSVRAAAEVCGKSESTIARLIRTTRRVLNLPPGDANRFRPAELAAIILDRLGADSPLAVNQARQGHSAPIDKCATPQAFPYPLG